MADVLDPGPASPTPLRLLAWADSRLGSPVDYHMHTTHTDGTATVLEMAKAAASAGIEQVLFSEHVRHTSTYYPAFAQEVRSLKCRGLVIQTGIETKVLDFDGHLDCSQDIASLCDAIVASVHSPPPNDRGGARGWSQFEAEEALELEFKLALAIVTKSRANILGHPMGMAITRFNLDPIEQLYELACACLDSGKAFELNPRYCSSPGDWLNLVERAGCKVSFGSDAHKTSDVGRAWELFALSGSGSD